MTIEVSVCPGTLKKGFTTYSPGCLRRVFAGKKVNHVLPYESAGRSEEDNQKFIENRNRISISGAQEKMSFILEKNKLRLTRAGEVGNYILKPIPRDLKFVEQAPANEHLTMQIAQQVYGIDTAPNALIFFRSGEQAYITKRFDVKSDGTKCATEDFASLAERTLDSHGKEYKYGNISYEEVAGLIRKYVGAYQIEIEKYYRLILFNFLFSNGDAHLKNFSLIETISGDFIMSPVYDLLNTRIHVADTVFALKKGLYADGTVRNPSRNDLLKFGLKIGVKVKRRDKIFETFLNGKDLVYDLINRSYLNDRTKKSYTIDYNTRYNVIKK